MSKISLKQKIEQITGKALHDYFKLRSKPEVTHYNYATLLGSLPAIDYAIPLFGYAQEAKKEAAAIYKHLDSVLTAQIACKTEFVNGYANILIDDAYLRDTLQAQLESKGTTGFKLGGKAALIHSSDDPSTITASALINECLQHIGTETSELRPLTVRPANEEIKRQLNKIPGTIQDVDSKALYIELDDEPHALRSAKGGWRELALLLAAIKQQLDQDKKVFVLGLSEKNQLLRRFFPTIDVLDIDVHARHLADMSPVRIYELFRTAQANFSDRPTSSHSIKQRRELLYLLDFNYEIFEALRSGDLKRAIGEITTLMKQQPVSDVAGN